MLLKTIIQSKECNCFNHLLINLTNAKHCQRITVEYDVFRQHCRYLNVIHFKLSYIASHALNCLPIGRLTQFTTILHRNKHFALIRYLCADFFFPTNIRSMATIWARKTPKLCKEIVWKQQTYETSAYTLHSNENACIFLIYGSPLEI